MKKMTLKVSRTIIKITNLTEMLIATMMVEEAKLTRQVKEITASLENLVMHHESNSRMSILWTINQKPKVCIAAMPNHNTHQQCADPSSPF